MVVKIVVGSGFLLLLQAAVVTAQISCTETQACVGAFQEGSECVDGYCTNPFSQGGCLARKIPDWHKIRVCTSEDPPDAAELGWCRPSPMEYLEVRTVALNWESAFFSTWIVQILLSELLGVPSSAETGQADLNVDFYNIQNRMDYGPVEAEHEALLKARMLDGDCAPALRNGEPCAHVTPEVWAEDGGYYDGLEDDGVIEELIPLGVLAEQLWYIPKFTAKAHPELGNYQGLLNRTILADIFLAPTSWSQYCQEISADNCSTPDGIATRPPEDWEADAMYGYDEYIGHFRKLPEQDCEVYPDTCFGHIADYPCGWGSYTRQNAYNLGLPLRSTGPDTNGGYSYTQLTQIWAAADHTKSHVIQQWWKPESLYETYVGTDAEFTRVTLPAPTQTCINNRVTSIELCEAPDDVAAGSPLGACENPAQALRKGVSTTLKTISQNDNLDPELWSPAYELVQNFRITELQYGEIFTAWLNRGVDAYGFDPREAVCQWVVDNLESLQKFVPSSYPRTLQVLNRQEDGLYMAVTVLSLLGAFLILVSAVMTYGRRKTKAMYYTNEIFMYLIQSGMICIAVAAWLLTIEAQDVTCVVATFLENVGFSLALMPLVIRMDAINVVFSAGRHMQRVRVETHKLLLQTAILTGAVIAFVLVWTIVDMPSREVYHEMRGENDKGETVVTATDYCGSESGLWYAISIAWRSVLLLFVGATAFMASRVREDLNDTRSLSLLITAHLVFGVIRLTMLILRDSVDPVQLMGYRGIILGTEVIVALLVFVYPKIFEKTEKQESGEPLPDLFLKTTILHAHIIGLAAWSSVREPAQVFKFLETIYSMFDDISEKRRAFKVETIGGTYVAATGIPHERNDHALAMAQFAWDIQTRFNRLVKELELLYGPDTGDLSLRIGIHSGAVTGGFLKGKGARFQLFGDTVIIAHQMEETCEPNRIQVSEKTADALKLVGKKRWLAEREQKVFVKGHGDMQTFWLSKKRRAFTDSDPDIDRQSSIGTDVLSDDELRGITQEHSLAERKRRLVDWNVEVLQKLLKQIAARRSASMSRTRSESIDANSVKLLSINDSDNDNPLDEVREIIWLPKFDQRAAKRQKEVDEITLPDEVVHQLHFFVTTVAEMYRENPFHNFAHASHVVMATLKSMNRIIAPTTLETDESQMHVLHKAAAALHDHTYGITSDPLTQFACVFSALIHDLDHPGVPNTQLIKEDPKMAAAFNNRSVAEQNSFQLAWKMLMHDDFRELRRAIGGDLAGLSRFRQLVINAVMATDLGDKQLKQLRNDRWAKAFERDKPVADVEPAAADDDVNRKATIVIEHLIQASDVSHTMQHWEVYREWNENLFREMYNAYREGRAEKNPADFWYKGEIGFFDFYIIPLSKKLNDCGVFGITSDENLTYANRNRELWVSSGEEATAEMLHKCEAEWEAKLTTIPEESFETKPEAAPELA